MSRQQLPAMLVAKFSTKLEVHELPQSHPKYRMIWYFSAYSERICPLGMGCSVLQSTFCMGSKISHSPSWKEMKIQLSSLTPISHFRTCIMSHKTVVLITNTSIARKKNYWLLKPLHQLSLSFWPNVTHPSLSTSIQCSTDPESSMCVCIT